MITIEAKGAENFEAVYSMMRGWYLDDYAHEKVNTGHWQSIKGTPHSQTRELQYVAVNLSISATPGSWAAYMLPNLPWAEDHFQERVCGEPLNPGEEYLNWPWYQGGVEDHKAAGEFSHTYMERYWPKLAGYRDPEGTQHYNHGVRYKYGDLNDLLHLLQREPHTRQAYLPIWFPEDIHAAAIDHERVPCSLGYHFMLRDERLHCFYPMRSVDFVRYLRDDLYMTGRLVQWIIWRLRTLESAEYATSEEYQKAPGLWREVRPGNLMFTASSCHIFEGDVPKLTAEHEKARDEKLAKGLS